MRTMTIDDFCSIKAVDAVIVRSNAYDRAWIDSQSAYDTKTSHPGPRF